MYPNTMPWWLQWIDGRALLLIIVIIVLLIKLMRLNDANIYDANDCCKACGEHISDAHQPNCALDAEENDEY